MHISYIYILNINVFPLHVHIFLHKSYLGSQNVDYHVFIHLFYRIIY